MPRIAAISAVTTVSLRLLAPLLAGLAAIGPFAIDTYLPAFPEIAADLGASQLEVQQSLTLYLAAFAVMSLWHGALSDALGRRPVVLAGLWVFALASFAAMFATRIEHLWAVRLVQGLSAGTGMIVGRAVVRDVVEGAAAQRLMAQSAVMFALAPAVAPIVGGAVLAAGGWRAVFGLLGLLGLTLLACARAWLPETLPHERRQSLHPLNLLRSYGAVFSHARFLGLAGALAANFLGFFLYVLSAPVFLMQHLGVSAQGFGWLFVPTVTGMMAGSWVSGRLAGKLSARASVRRGYLVMLCAAACNMLANSLTEPALPWAVLPIMAYNFGMAIAMPALQLLVLDLYPMQRGLVSSCLGFLQSVANTLGAGVLAPLLWGSTLELALGMGVLACLGLTLFAGPGRAARS